MGSNPTPDSILLLLLLLYLCLYRGPSSTRVDVRKAPVVKTVSKKNELNNNLKIYYREKKGKERLKEI